MKEIICITGLVTSFHSKALAKRALQVAGHEVKNSVTKSVTLLINETGIKSAKYKKAVAEGIPIIYDLEAFLKPKKKSKKKHRAIKTKAKNVPVFFKLNQKAKSLNKTKVFHDLKGPGILLKVYKYKDTYVYRDKRLGWGIKKGPLDIYLKRKLRYQPLLNAAVVKEGKADPSEFIFFETNETACNAIDLNKTLLPLVLVLDSKGLPDFYNSTISFLALQSGEISNSCGGFFTVWVDDPTDSAPFSSGAPRDNFEDFDSAISIFMNGFPNSIDNIHEILQFDLLNRFHFLSATTSARGASSFNKGKCSENFLNFFLDNRETKIYDNVIQLLKSITELVFIHPGKNFVTKEFLKVSSPKRVRDQLSKLIQVISLVLMDHWLYNHPFLLGQQGALLSKTRFKIAFDGLLVDKSQIGLNHPKLNYANQLVDLFIEDDLIRLARVVELQDKQPAPTEEKS